MSETEDIWLQAREWFNNMNQNSRNQMILTMYKLCIGIRDISHEKLMEAINNQWNEKFNKQSEFIKRLTIENEILSKNQENGINTLVNKIKDLESNLNNSVNVLSSKITPSSNGKLGEDYIDQILSKIPNSSFINITQQKGGGDFLLVLGDIKIMIESKNWTNSSIKGNPKEIENFRKTAVQAKEERDVDFAIMALHRVTDIKGRPMEIEIENTKNGAMMLLYVTNLFNHPDRILYAIDAGILLLKQQSQYKIDKERFIYQINNFMKGISNMEESIKDRQKIIKDLNILTIKDTEQLLTLKHMLDDVLNNTDQLTIKDKIIKYYIDIMKTNKNQKITKHMLETKCLENKIPARHVRLLGGIKAIKELAIKHIGDNKQLYGSIEGINNIDQIYSDDNNDNNSDISDSE